jgi:hypothetical protein
MKNPFVIEEGDIAEVLMHLHVAIDAAGIYQVSIFIIVNNILFDILLQKLG